MEQKDIRDAVWKRRSVRKYFDKPIEKDKIDILRRSTASLNKASGLSMEFIEEFDFKSILTLMFKNVRSVIVVKGKKSDPHLEEKCGYHGEHIVLEATAMGLGTCWVAHTFNKKSGSMNVADDETVVCVISVGYGTEGMSESAEVPDAPHRKTKSVSDFLKGNTDVPGWIITAMKSVQFAPTALNHQRTRFSYSDGVLSAEAPSGTLNMIDFGISKFHFELYAGGKFDLGSPGLFRKD